MKSSYEGQLTAVVAGGTMSVARFGAYELVRELGRGAMGEVWLAHRAVGDGLEKTVALKFLPRHRDDDARARLDFQREVRLSMHLSHSAIVQVFDVSEHDGRACMVMEWVDGVDLARLLAHLRQRGERFPVSTSLHVIIQVLRALDYAHNLHHEGQPLGMVHRDVSPHNILISTSGDVKLTDFGIARVAREETSGAHVRGKLRYMAPEQFSGAPRSPSFDLYAVGAVAHELLSGRRFRGHEGDGELYRAIHEGLAPTLDREDVPPALRRLRAQLLEVDPAGRPPSAQDCLEALAGVSMEPGAAEDLGRRCRAFMGVDGPRSGEYEALSTSPRAAETSAPWEASGDEVEDAPGDASRRTATMPPAPTDVGAAAFGRRRGRTWIAVGVSLVAVAVPLTFAVQGRAPASPALESAMNDAPGDETSAAGLTDTVAPEDGRATGRPSTTTLAGGAREGTAARDARGPRSKGQGARAALEELRAVPSASPASRPVAEVRPQKADATAETARPPAAALPRVTVTFRASDYDFAYVRLRGRSYALEPSAKVRLPAGRQRVYMRESADAPAGSRGADLEGGRALRRPTSSPGSRRSAGSLIASDDQRAHDTTPASAFSDRRVSPVSTWTRRARAGPGPCDRSKKSVLVRRSSSRSTPCLTISTPVLSKSEVEPPGPSTASICGDRGCASFDDPISMRTISGPFFT